MKNDVYTEKKHEFWPHFLLGALVGVSGVFFFGTQKGRKMLKKALDATEDLEFSAKDVISDIERKIDEGKETIGASETIQTVLQKIKSVIPHKD